MLLNKAADTMFSHLPFQTPADHF